MERELFDYKAWDQVDIGCLLFYKCTLLVDIDQYKKDDTFGSICVDFNKGIFEIYNEEGTEVMCSKKMKLVFVD